MKQTHRVGKAVAQIGSLQVTVTGLIVLAALVVGGTLYQVDNGIYAAQERFFNAWFILIGGYIPFPAVKTVVAVLSINLLAAALKKRPVNIGTAGILIMHLGVAALIGGSALSSSVVRESTITLSEGQQTSEAYDFATWQIVVSVNGLENGKPFSKIVRRDLRRLRKGQNITLSPASALVTVHRSYRNCGAAFDTDTTTITGLSPLPASKEQGRNFPGIAFSFNDGNSAAPQANREYFVWAGSTVPVLISSGTTTVAVSLQPLALPLPLKAALRTFTVEWHPGTTKAKRFESRMRMLGKNIDREVVIEMNRPFRYRSFTFYQMGYGNQNGRYTSTIAIVKNPLKYVPYVSSLVIVAGMLLHFFVKIVRHHHSNRSGRHA